MFNILSFQLQRDVFPAVAINMDTAPNPTNACKLKLHFFRILTTNNILYFDPSTGAISNEHKLYQINMKNNKKGKILRNQ